jgi:transcriptional repressor NrdR
MQALKGLDDVAYVRFASVYRSFKDIGEFVDLIQKYEGKTGSS